MMWKRLCFLFAIVAGALLDTADPVSASDVCQLAPWVETGQSGVLGFYYGGGLQCATEHVALTLGARATQFGNNVLQPVAAITYRTSLGDNWALSLKTSLRERIGDYEVNALPEVSVLWTAPRLDREVQLSGKATWGSYAATTVPVIIQRTQLKMTASWPVWHISPVVNAGFSLTGAHDDYSTGDTQSWVQADFRTWGPLSRSVDWSWSLADRNGWGVSPLKFDGNSTDAWTSAAITFHINSKWDVSVRGTYDFYTSTMNSAQLEVRTTAFGIRAIGFAYDITNGTVAGIWEMPHGGNIGLRYDQSRSAVLLFSDLTY